MWRSVPQSYDENVAGYWRVAQTVVPGVVRGHDVATRAQAVASLVWQGAELGGKTCATGSVDLCPTIGMACTATKYRDPELRAACAELALPCLNGGRVSISSDVCLTGSTGVCSMQELLCRGGDGPVVLNAETCAALRYACSATP